MKLPPGHVAGVGVVKPTGYGGLGERLLRGMGWETGQGLGKEKTGITEAIQVKKKENTVGVSVLLQSPVLQAAAFRLPCLRAPAVVATGSSPRLLPCASGGRQRHLRLAGQVVGARV